MARRFTFRFTGQNTGAPEYVRDYIDRHFPEGYERLGDFGFTIYAANIYDPKFRSYLSKMSADLRKKDLPHIIHADDSYDVYRVSRLGVKRIGEYEVVGLDPEGAGPIVEYRELV